MSAEKTGTVSCALHKMLLVVFLYHRALLSLPQSSYSTNTSSSRAVCVSATPSVPPWLVLRSIAHVSCFQSRLRMSIIIDHVTNPPGYALASFPDPTPSRGKGSGVLRAISWACRMQNVMATHRLVCRSRMQQWYGLVCAAGALSHEKSHVVNLIGAPDIRTATSSSPRNCSKYTRPSSPHGSWVWVRD